MIGSRMLMILIAAAMFMANIGMVVAEKDVTFVGSYDTGIASHVAVSGN